MEDGKVETEIERRCPLPGEGGIGRRLDGTAGQAVHLSILSGPDDHIGTTDLRDISSDTIGKSRGETIDPGHLLHEVLLVHRPGGTERPEWLVLDLRVGAEEIGLIDADTTGEIVLIQVIVGEISVHRDEAIVMVGHPIVAIGGEGEATVHRHRPGEIGKLTGVIGDRSQRNIIVTHQVGRGGGGVDPPPLRTGEGSQSVVLAEAGVVIGLHPCCIAGHPSTGLAEMPSLRYVRDITAILEDSGGIPHLPDGVRGGISKVLAVIVSLLHLQLTVKCQTGEQLIGQLSIDTRVAILPSRPLHAAITERIVLLTLQPLRQEIRLGALTPLRRETQIGSVVYYGHIRGKAIKETERTGGTIVGVGSSIVTRHGNIARETVRQVDQITEREADRPIT